MEAQLLADAIVEYRLSLESVAEGLAASPAEPELLELKAQLEAALQDAEAALAGLQPEEEQQQQQQRQGGGGPEQAPAGPAAAPAAHPPAAAQPRRAVPGSSNARIHPRSKYAYEEPDFAALAQLYPSLAPFLLRTGGGGSAAGAAAAAAAGVEAAAAEDAAEIPAKPGAAAVAPGSTPARASIDFTSPAACRELTRVLLRHDFGVEWWVPLGQLVPPVTNRANYIHWLQDLLSLSAPGGGMVIGLDIGCGANLIYPLLGACLAGWRMIGADCTPAALEWAARNLGANPQLAGLIELRAVGMQPEQAAYLQAAVAGAAAGKAGAAGTAGAASKAGPEPAAETGAPAAGQDGAAAVPAAAEGPGTSGQAAAAGAADGTSDAQAAAAQAQAEAEVEAEAVAAEALAAAPAVASAAPAPVLRLSASQAAGSGIISGALRKGEQIAFCMCNPPFFESLEEAGRNPATAYGGTAPEMVYPGGELAFVSGMVQDSLALRGAVHWYTTMVVRVGSQFV
ncbi:hypothetical protein COHA_003449 [Chlorella ohadii]|uniref:U6 small nuclear RNA (adenine-(43)-N(6))-methyltransferase n=1 Tax=Chlorella ohadii TaxID=2649997 RepID=A0AAD5DVR4_9CHLO|nr:hypothetical protein COHA_003449 [Chlorella ohadii]